MWNATRRGREPSQWRPGHAVFRLSLMLLLALALICSACSTPRAPSPSIRPVVKEPPPAVLTAPESESLKTYSVRVRAWVKKVADTLNP